ncbi:MAG TPA: Hsp20/alpha crystallin family protein [Candidatus Udaeobacter sp.]|jgi:HSP20 family protein|nr:Hsp20/alpha crystallin family protein [Candidatus Udaeobacter sp.]
MNTLTREPRESDRSQAEQFITPPASVTEIGDGYVLEIEMPGVKKDGLEISVEDNELTIIGRRSLPVVEGTLIHRESRPENFRRVFEIDPSIDAGKIGAKIDQGLVTLSLPKADHVKPRKITVS